MADLEHVTTATARKHLRAKFGPGRRTMGAERWPLDEVLGWLYGTGPPPPQDEWQ